MLVCARFECACASSDATSWPTSRARSIAQNAPSRSSAARRAGSASNALWPCSGGTWLAICSSGCICPRQRAGCEVDQGGDVCIAVAGERADERFADGPDQRGRGRLLVVQFELPALDALGQHLDQHVAVAAAEDQA